MHKISGIFVAALLICCASQLRTTAAAVSDLSASMDAYRAHALDALPVEQNVVAVGAVSAEARRKRDVVVSSYPNVDPYRMYPATAVAGMPYYPYYYQRTYKYVPSTAYSNLGLTSVVYG